MNLMNLMNLVALPALADDTLGMLHDGHPAGVVDPGDSARVEHALDAQALALAGILGGCRALGWARPKPDSLPVTHHHPKRVGKLNALREWNNRSR